MIFVLGESKNLQIWQKLCLEFKQLAHDLVRKQQKIEVSFIEAIKQMNRSMITNIIALKLQNLNYKNCFHRTQFIIIKIYKPTMNQNNTIFWNYSICEKIISIDSSEVKIVKLDLSKLLDLVKNGNDIVPAIHDVKNQTLIYKQIHKNSQESSRNNTFRKPGLLSRKKIRKFANNAL